MVAGRSNENYEVDLKKEMMCLDSMHGFVDARVGKNLFCGAFDESCDKVLMC